MKQFSIRFQDLTLNGGGISPHLKTSHICDVYVGVLKFVEEERPPGL
jgi:hypothetical protein